MNIILLSLIDYWVLLYVEDNALYVTSVHAYRGTISCAIHDIDTWNKYVSEGKIPLSVITGNYENIDSSPIFSIAYYYLSHGNIANIMRTYFSSLSTELSPEDQGNIMELQNRLNIFSQIIIY